MNTPHDATRVPLQQLLGRLADDLQAQPVPPLQAAPAPVPPPARADAAPGPGAHGHGRRPWTWSTWSAWPGRRAATGRSGHGVAAPLAWGGALACVLVLLGAGWLMVQAPPGLGTDTWLAETRPLRDTGFLPVAEPARWAGVDAPGLDGRAAAGPGEAGTASHAMQAAWVVRTELPAERLALLGLPYDPGRAARPVRAELLLHASGDVLAVRVLP